MAFVRLPPSGESAKTMALIGFVFQCLASALVFFLGLSFPFLLFAGAGDVVFAAIVLAIVVVTAFALYVGYAWVYERIRRGEFQRAREPTLVLGILGVIFGGVITGVFYLVAYGELGDAIREMQWPGAMYYGPGYGWYPPPTMPVPPPPPASVPGLPIAPPCVRCGRPTVLIVAYGRYYCYTDQLYV